ncbi:hypothetical protein [Bradyrhizobium sp. DASA03007]|uniref:hypothetical protein n=1 Tax=unclassified Bradyrhizobium TaxID=2631580 RepID=UPI003F71912B
MRSTSAIAAIGGTGKAGLVDGNPGQILLQLEGVGMTLVSSGVISFVLLELIDLTIGLRVSRKRGDRPRPRATWRGPSAAEASTLKIVASTRSYRAAATMFRKLWRADFAVPRQVY